jgi:3-oxoacyl-[acyl-carrier protein] reductase
VTGVSRRGGIGFAIARRLGAGGLSTFVPDDGARLIAWLASEDAGWVTGQVIDSDGGFTYGGS